VDHWVTHAKNWHLIGPPLRPSEDCIRVFERIAKNCPASSDAHEALLLGITPELASMTWPVGTRLRVVERCQAMLDMYHRGPWRRTTKTIEHLGDWRRMSRFAKGSQDLVIGDGCFTTLREREYDTVLRQIHGVLRPGGVFAHRWFLRPSTPDKSSSFRDSFHAFKLQLLMSLQKSFEQGVEVKQAYEWWSQRQLDIAAWPAEEVATIAAYAGSDALYTFPTEAELAAKLDKFFHLELCHVVEGYDLSERCPVIMCVRKDDDELQR